MRAGRLRHRVVLQSKTETRDSYGSAIIGWTNEATVSGGIEPLSGRELFAQGQVQSEAQVRIVIRRYPGVNETWRVRHGSKYYDITEVLKSDTRSPMLTLMCREGVSDDAVTNPDMLLLEDGFFLLLESGDNLLLEA